MFCVSGIQRATLLKREYLALVVMGVSYMLAAVVYEMSIISEIDSMSDEEDNSNPPSLPLISSMLLSFLNLVAVSWIYFSIIRVIDELEKEKQTAKKKMYEKLSKALILWFVVGFLAEVLFYSSLSGSVDTPWKYDMVPKFIWDCLFFAVVVQIGYLWYPSPVTSQYAYSQQIPMHDLDEFDAIDMDDDLDKEIEFSKCLCSVYLACLNTGSEHTGAYGKENGMDLVDEDDEFDRLGEESDSEDEEQDKLDLS